MAPELGPTAARQGVTLRITRYVLGFGLAFVVVALIVAYAFVV